MLLAETSSLGSTHGLRLPDWVVVLGANTGGPQALLEILPGFPSHFPGAIIVVQQMRSGFTRVLADQLSQICTLPVCEIEDGQMVHGERIYVTPADARLTIVSAEDALVPAYRAILEDIGDDHDLKHTRVDTTMASAAVTFGRRAIGVLLAGIGLDGKEGMRAIRDAGGVTIAQDEASSVVHALPASAIDAGLVEEVLPLWSMTEHIVGVVGGRSSASAA